MRSRRAATPSLVVEHDEATMRRADYIIDLGPGAGVNGGKVVAGGTLGELMAHEHSVTAAMFARTRNLSRARAAAARRPGAGSRPELISGGREPAQVEKPDGGFSAAAVYMFDWRERVGQEHPVARMSAAGRARRAGAQAAVRLRGRRGDCFRRGFSSRRL